MEIATRSISVQVHEMKYLKIICVTVLAWLGLAGLTDNMIEWQSWFEQGIMVHWRSIKAWFSAVVFGWFPWEIPDWFYDYVIIGGLYTRGMTLGIDKDIAVTT